jgi:hypothetical protein
MNGKDLDMIAKSRCSASPLLVAGPQYQEIEAVYYVLEI